MLQYERDLQAGTSVPPITMSSGDARVLRNLYRRLRTGDESPLKAAVILPVNERARLCPYCDLTEARQIDHYLPKDKYPEFSVALRNLIPCCADCNNLKRTSGLDAKGARIFHAYVDGPHPCFLECDVQWPHGVPVVSYQVSRPPQISPSIFAGSRDHFDGLQLASRFANRARNELAENAIFHKMTTAQRTVAHQVAIIQGRSLTKLVGPNHWKSALYVALERSLR